MEERERKTGVPVTIVGVDTLSKSDNNHVASRVTGYPEFQVLHHHGTRCGTTTKKTKDVQLGTI